MKEEEEKEEEAAKNVLTAPTGQQTCGLVAQWTDALSLLHKTSLCQISNAESILGSVVVIPTFPLLNFLPLSPKIFFDRGGGVKGIC